MKEAYPLSWPVGYKRTKNPKRNTRYGKQLTLAQARDSVMRELKLFNAKDIVISTNIPVKKDGLPYGRYAPLQDTGVAVYFKLQDKDRVLCCDEWHKIEHNLHSIAKTIDSFRGIARWGVSEILDRVFTGFPALPENAGQSFGNWWNILGIHKTNNPDVVRDAFYQLAKKHHPDKGGERENWENIKNAYEDALKSLI